MLKKILTITLFLTFLFNFVAAQDTYIVQQIRGSIRKGGQAVRIGDRLNSSDKLKFTKGSIMLVSSSKYGKDCIKPTPAPNVSEITATFIDLLPKSRRASTRGILSNQAAFATNFGEGKFRVYGKYAFQAASGSYPLSESSFFYLSYTYQGKTINKQLNFEGEYCLMDFNSVYTIEKMPVDTAQIDSADLYFYDEKNQRNEKLVSFKPEFVNVITDKADIQEIIDFMKTANACYKEIWMSVRSYLSQKYGIVSNDNMEEFLKVEFKVLKDQANCTN